MSIELMDAYINDRTYIFPLAYYKENMDGSLA